MTRRRSLLAVTLGHARAVMTLSASRAHAIGPPIQALHEPIQFRILLTSYLMRRTAKHILTFAFALATSILTACLLSS